MFDIGFTEIIVCGIVALIVIGPERMPETVRAVGLWIGRLKRSLRETRVEIERQIGVDEIRQQLHNEDIMKSLEDVRKNLDEAMKQAQIDVNLEEHDNSRTFEHQPELPDHSHQQPALDIDTHACAPESPSALITPPSEPKTPL